MLKTGFLRLVYSIELSWKFPEKTRESIIL